MMHSYLYHYSTVLKTRLVHHCANGSATAWYFTTVALLADDKSQMLAGFTLPSAESHSRHNLAENLILPHRFLPRAPYWVIYHEHAWGK